MLSIFIGPVAITVILLLFVRLLMPLLKLIINELKRAVNHEDTFVKLFSVVRCEVLQNTGRTSAAIVCHNI